MPILTCTKCNFSGEGKKFSNHLLKEHKIKSIDFTIKELYGGERPTCRECGSETRYSSWKFKEYCKDHSHFAMKNKVHKIYGAGNSIMFFDMKKDK